LHAPGLCETTLSDCISSSVETAEAEISSPSPRESISIIISNCERDFEFEFSLLARSYRIREIETLGQVHSQRYATGVKHIGWAIAGAVLPLYEAIFVSAGTLSLLMKRMETRLSKRILFVRTGK
jgi:hypothetical protein